MSATASPRAVRAAAIAAAIDANIRAHFRAASPDAIAIGMIWYDNARLHAHAIGLAARKSMEVGAAIIASFSPLTGWDLNLRRAWTFATTGHAATFGAHNRMATLALTLGVDAVTGPKVNPFARAMIGDLSQVPCDSWMNFAATYGPDTDEAREAARIHKAQAKVPALNETRRAAVEATCRAIAEEEGIMPAQVQAIVWINARGAAF